MAEVKLKQVRKLFGDVIAVEDFTLDIEDGEFIILVGASGCGKTTTLRMLAGLEKITSGSIYIDNTMINNVLPKNRDIAMVFQNYALYPHMNVYKNMAFCLKLRKTPRSDIERVVRDAAQLLGIEELLQRKPNELSGGQRQRVALGRAIVRQPKVFLFDEPLSNLDAKLRIAMRAELLDLHQRLRTTTIYVTHDQLEAMTMADRIVVMHQGAIQQVDTPQNVYDYPANKYVAGFIGAPTMNFFDGHMTESGGDLYVTAGDMRLRVPDRHRRTVEAYGRPEVVLGLRPEHVAEKHVFKDLDPANTFSAQVWVVEPLGSEKLVYFKSTGGNFVARMDAHTSCRPGDELELSVDLVRGHLFDPRSEKTIF